MYHDIVIKMLIYQIIHKDSGYRYIGQTTRKPIKRWREHLYSLRANKHPNRYLQSAWNKYGENAFEFQILKQCNSLEELNKSETEMIKNGLNLFNLAEGGNAFQHSEEAKEYIANSNKIPVVGMNIKTGEIKEYPSAADTKKDGFDEKSVRKCAIEYVAKRNSKPSRSISHRGWVWMEKTKYTFDLMSQKAILAKRAKVHNERAVIGMKVSSGDIVRFKSSQEAGRHGFRGSNVYRACKAHVSVHKGFVWVYGDSESPQSLLKAKRDCVLSKTRTGPKSCQ